MINGMSKGMRTSRAYAQAVGVGLLAARRKGLGGPGRWLTVTLPGW